MIPIDIAIMLEPRKQVQSLFATHQPNDVDFTLITLNANNIDLTK
jgi:hypothetical protein